MALSPLFAELLTAWRLARRPELADAVAACNLVPAPWWGAALVETDGPFYQPCPDGQPAIVTGVHEYGTLIDLVAVSFTSRAMRRRTGLGRALGVDRITDCIELGRPLTLFADALAWLAAGRRGAVILDWSDARSLLADVPGIVCQSTALARRVRDAFELPPRLPPLFVPEAPLFVPEAKETHHAP